MDTNSLHVGLVEEIWEECIPPRKRGEWTEKRSKDCEYNFRAGSKNNFFSQTCCSKHQKKWQEKTRVIQGKIQTYWCVVPM